MDPIKERFRKLNKQERKLSVIYPKIQETIKELEILKIKSQLAYNKYVLTRYGSFQEMHSARVAAEHKTAELWALHDKELRIRLKRDWLYKKLVESSNLTA